MSEKLSCKVCDGDEIHQDDDGHFYCSNCCSLVEDIIETGVADEDFIDKGKPGRDAGGPIYSAAHTRHVSQQQSQQPPPDHVGPTHPADFGSVPRSGAPVKIEDFYKAVRLRYVLGVQLMVEYQCEALVSAFRVDPLVCGVAGGVWGKFVESTRVFDAGWADRVWAESEQGEKKVRKATTYDLEPQNMYKERMVILWCKALKKKIPLSCSLAISYLACHIVREPVLPTDILKWSLEGKLPYFGAFPKIEESIKQIERLYERPSIICPLKANYMFRPSQAVPLQKLESMAASIAQSVGLNLPPVNFYGIASRFLKQLSLPVEKIIPYACRIQEWSMPPGLWLSANESRLPARVFVMSILIVAIRILYNINGFGKWETTLSSPIGSSSMDEEVASPAELNIKENSEEGSTSQTFDKEPEESLSPVHKYQSDCEELLQTLEMKYDNLKDIYEYSKDLPTYLQYCKDVVFAGLEPLYKTPDFTDELWDFYQKNRENIEMSEELEAGLNQKRSRDSNKVLHTPKENKKHRDDENTCSESANSGGSPLEDSIAGCSPSGDYASQTSQEHQTSATTDKGESSQLLRNIAIRHMKIDMEGNRFCYIPPRVNVKRHDYLHYVRKRDNGSLTYVAHADYYILLRACAKVAQVDIRVMHAGVLSLEKRLGWIEKRIDYCLQDKCSISPSTVPLSNLNS